MSFLNVHLSFVIRLLCLYNRMCLSVSLDHLLVIKYARAACLEFVCPPPQPTVCVSGAPRGDRGGGRGRGGRGRGAGRGGQGGGEGAPQ